MQTLKRAVAVMAAFDEGDGTLSMGQIAGRAELPQSTAYRLVNEMIELGLLERTGRSISLGMRVFEFGQLASRRRRLREVALPYIADLREATHQTIHLATMEHTEVVYLEILPAHHGPPLPSRVGGRLPAYSTGIGKAMLAFCPPALVDEVVDGRFAKMGPGTILEPAELLRQLKKARTTNIAYDHEESAARVVCAASPILDATGRPLAGISASGWSGKVDLRRVSPAVMTCARAISRAAVSRGVSRV
ncbi:IclR family transcriptional regulator [Gordonia bronchialis]|uniref:IclR family transcriptional regulator n=1 Tax=Gordonia bronchialis TaxID=2054 RepID=UPI00226DEAD6|nr:IclR family transcriptional regulator [Gordonia bronchialis]